MIRKYYTDIHDFRGKVKNNLFNQKPILVTSGDFDNMCFRLNLSIRPFKAQFSPLLTLFRNKMMAVRLLKALFKGGGKLNSIGYGK
jgi:hypothetical protein